MSEQLGFQQPRGNGGAVQSDKGALAPGTEIVDGACNPLLAGSSFPVEQDRGIRGRYDSDLFQDFLQGWAVADNAFEAVLRADFSVVMKLLVFESAQPGRAWFCQLSEVCEIHSRAPHNLLRIFTFAVLGELLYEQSS